MNIDRAFLTTLPMVGIALMPAVILITRPYPESQRNQVDTCCLDLVDASIPFQPTETK